MYACLTLGSRSALFFWLPLLGSRTWKTHITGWELGTYLGGNREPSQVKTAFIKIFLYLYHEQWSSQESYGALQLSTPQFSQTLSDSLSPGSPCISLPLSLCLYCSLTRSSTTYTRGFQGPPVLSPHKPTPASLQKTHFSPELPQRRENGWGA